MLSNPFPLGLDQRLYSDELDVQLASGALAQTYNYSLEAEYLHEPRSSYQATTTAPNYIACKRGHKDFALPMNSVNTVISACKIKEVSFCTTTDETAMVQHRVDFTQPVANPTILKPFGDYHLLERLVHHTSHGAPALSSASPPPGRYSSSEPSPGGWCLTHDSPNQFVSITRIVPIPFPTAPVAVEPSVVIPRY